MTDSPTPSEAPEDRAERMRAAAKKPISMGETNAANVLVLLDEVERLRAFVVAFDAWRHAPGAPPLLFTHVDHGPDTARATCQACLAKVCSDARRALDPEEYL